MHLSEERNDKRREYGREKYRNLQANDTEVLLEGFNFLWRYKKLFSFK